MSELTSAVCSITPTSRRRFFWAAWWTGAPTYQPFRKPDASSGGASSLEEALADASRVAGIHLSLIEPYWATAWKGVLRGQTPAPPPTRARPPRRPSPGAAPQNASAWSVLGLKPGAPLSEVKQAFRKRALETHPDRGGDPDVFRAANEAYEKLSAKLTSTAEARRKR